MKQNSQYLRLQENLLYLNLKQMHLHLDHILDSNVSLLEGLLKLTDYEIEIKRENKRRSLYLSFCSLLVVVVYDNIINRR